MGQKANPIGLRLGIVKTWDSRWFATKNYAETLEEDLMIKRYIKQRLSQAGISKILIERAADKTTVTIKTARPGLVIGRRGQQVDQLKDELQHLTGKQVFLNIEEVKRPDGDAQLVAEHIAKHQQRLSGIGAIDRRHELRQRCRGRDKDQPHEGLADAFLGSDRIGVNCQSCPC